MVWKPGRGRGTPSGVERQTHGAREITGDKWLLDERDGGRDDPAANDLVIGVPGHVDNLAAAADGEHPSGGHGVARIHGKVEEHLLELARVRDHLPGQRRECRDDLDVVAEHSLEHYSRILDDPVDVERPWLQQLLAAEGQKLPGQSGGTGARLVDRLGILALRIVGPEGLACGARDRMARDNTLEVWLVGGTAAKAWRSATQGIT